MLRIEYTRDSHEDLEEIALHIALTNSFDVADDYLEQIDHVTKLISENPQMGISREEIDQNFRSFPCRSHIIYYYIDLERIVITRILHGAMDHYRHFE